MIRRDALARVLPKLRIAARCELHGRFLRVRGNRATYKGGYGLDQAHGPWNWTTGHDPGGYGYARTAAEPPAREFPPLNFAEQPQRIVDNTRPGGLRATDERIAEAVGASAGYIGQLRRGQRSSPSAELVAKIADFFDIDVRYFTDPETAEIIAA